jgi:hypothetical protein
MPWRTMATSLVAVAGVAATTTRCKVDRGLQSAIAAL